MWQKLVRSYHENFKKAISTRISGGAVGAPTYSFGKPVTQGILLIMKQVESYVTITEVEVTKALKDNDYIFVQGQNILFAYDDYRTANLQAFLDSVFTIVGKVAACAGKDKYYILSDRFGGEVIEPFQNYDDISEQLANDITKMSDFIGSLYTSKYDI